MIPPQIRAKWHPFGRKSKMYLERKADLWHNMIALLRSSGVFAAVLIAVLSEPDAKIRRIRSLYALCGIGGVLPRFRLADTHGGVSKWS